MKRRRLKESLEAEFLSKPSPSMHSHHESLDHASSPSTEASNDPAPSERSQGKTKAHDENKYLAAKPYRSKKGDRFS